jgi:hypothetical protein
MLVKWQGHVPQLARSTVKRARAATGTIDREKGTPISSWVARTPIAIRSPPSGTLSEPFVLTRRLLAPPSQKKQANVDFRHLLRDAVVGASPGCFNQSNEE